MNWSYTKRYVYDKAGKRYVTFLRKVTLSIPEDTHRAMLHAYISGSTAKEVCLEYEFPEKLFQEYRRVYGWTHSSLPFTAEELATQDVESLLLAEEERKVQEVHQAIGKARTKRTTEDAKKWQAWQAYVQTPLQELIAAHSPDTHPTPPPYTKAEWGETALVLSPSDLHWGSYGWQDEVGQTYSMDEARHRLHSTTEKIISRLPVRPAGIIVVLGSDWFNIDGDTYATTKGTLQDCDGTPAEIYWTGAQLAVEYIDRLAQEAPVQVLVIGGNHDRHNALTLDLYLAAWYRKSSAVSIHTSPSVRQYVTFGTTQMGFTHGDHVKPNELANLMAGEDPVTWGRTTQHIWFTGHLHRQMVQDVGGVTVYNLPSLSGPDRWLSRNGYTLARPGLMGHLVDAKEGVVCSLFAQPEKGTTSND